MCITLTLSPLDKNIVPYRYNNVDPEMTKKLSTFTSQQKIMFFAYCEFSDILLDSFLPFNQGQISFCIDWAYLNAAEQRAVSS